jgi:hypothetical protein
VIGGGHMSFDEGRLRVDPFECALWEIASRTCQHNKADEANHRSGTIGFCPRGGVSWTVTTLTEFYLRLISKALDFECVSIFLASLERLAMADMKGYDDKYKYQIYYLEQPSITARIFLKNECIWGTEAQLSEYDEYTGRCGLYIPRIKENPKGGLKHFLGVPLASHDGVRGVLKLETANPKRQVRTEDEMRARVFAKLYALDLEIVKRCELKTHHSDVEKALDRCFSHQFNSHPLLLCGPPGSGKYTLARYAHERGVRSERAFVPIPCKDLTSNRLQYLLGSPEPLGGRIERVGTVYFQNLNDLPRTNNDGKISQETFPAIIDALNTQDIKVVASTSDSSLSSTLLSAFAGSKVDLPSLAKRLPGDGELLVLHFAEEVYFGDGAGKHPRDLLAEWEVDGPKICDAIKEKAYSFQLKEFRQAIRDSSMQRYPLLPTVQRIASDMKEPNAAPDFTEIGRNVGPIGSEFEPESSFRTGGRSLIKALVTKSEKEEVVRRAYHTKMRGEGWSGPRLASYLGISYRHLQKYLKELGLTRKPKWEMEVSHEHSD